MKKRFSVWMMSALVAGACLLAGCGSNKTAATEDAKQEVQTVEQEKATESSTAPAESVEETENLELNAAPDQAILVVSFGTSYNDSRDVTIGAIENAIAKAFPEYEVRRAFTSQIIIDKLKERDGLEIDNVEEALDRAVADGIKTLVVQPTHLMNGYEYTDLADALKDYEDKFEQIPLVTLEWIVWKSW